jgi:hypothetical protein
MHPQTPHEGLTREIFVHQVRDELREAYVDALEASGLASELQSRMLSWNLERRFEIIHFLSYTELEKLLSQGRIDESFEIYSSVIDEEKTLLKYGDYISQAKHCLLQCFNVDSLIICFGDGSTPASCWAPHVDDEHRPTWMQKNHPQIVLKNVRAEYYDHYTSTTFQKAVFTILSTTQTPVKCFMFRQDMFWYPSVNDEWRTEGADFVNVTMLQHLKLGLCDNYRTKSMQGAFSRGLIPLLRSARFTLRSLQLSDSSHSFEEPSIANAESLRKILALNFRCLEELHICDLEIDCKQLASFIQEHSSLHVVGLIHCIGGNEELWPFVFSALRNHSQKIELRLHEDIATNFGDTFTVDSRSMLAVGTDDLYDYLHQKGDWTKELKELYGEML